MAVKKAAKKKTKKKARRQLTLKRMLAEIDKMLGMDHGSELASVLSALRGPDQDSIGPCNEVQVKRATTALIRNAAFPLNGWRCGDVLSSDTSGNLSVRATMHYDVSLTDELSWHTRHHFSSHVKNAFMALGLKWDEVNP